MINNRLLFKQLSISPEYTEVQLHPVSGEGDPFPIHSLKYEDGLYYNKRCEISTTPGTGTDGVKCALKHCAGKAA